MDPETVDTKQELLTDFSHLIDGELQGSDGHFDVINPATGRTFASCPAASREQLDAAVAAARRAFADWKNTSYPERATLLQKMAQALEQNQDNLGELLTREQGKPYAQAQAEIGRGGGQLTGLSKIPIPEEVLLDNEQLHIELHYRPLGVVGIITPWNAPINLALGPIAWTSSTEP